jgi:hypothetical protein
MGSSILSHIISICKEAERKEGELCLPSSAIERLKQRREFLNHILGTSVIFVGRMPSHLLAS